jgi:hypothetical protein
VRLRFLFMACLSTLLVTGCQNGSGIGSSAKPDEVVLQYFNLAKNAEQDRAMTMLCQADQGHKELLEKAGDVPILPLRDAELLPSFSGRTSCEIKTVDVQGDKATVVTRITHPDLNSWFENAPESAIIILIHAHNGIKAARQVIVEAMALTPLATEDRTFDLTKESSGWRIDLHLSDYPKIQEIQDRASAAESEGRFEEAENGYHEILKIYPHHPDAPRVLAALKADEDACKEATPYVAQIKVLSAKGEQDDSEDKIKAEAHLRNDSERAFHRVGVSYQLLDQRGKVIQEKVEFQRFASSKPLAPESEEDTSCTFDKVPSPWKGKVKARVKFLELAKGKGASIPFVEILASHYTEILSELVSGAKQETP